MRFDILLLFSNVLMLDHLTLDKPEARAMGVHNDVYVINIPLVHP